MAVLLTLLGGMLLILAIPAVLRARRWSQSGNSRRATMETARCALAIVGAIALFLIAKGRPA